MILDDDGVLWGQGEASDEDYLAYVSWLIARFAEHRGWIVRRRLQALSRNQESRMGAPLSVF